VRFTKFPDKKVTYFQLIGLLLIFTVLLIIITRGASTEKTLIINEFMASNRFVLPDEDGDYPDWIEIYNPTGSPVNLEGYWLSDNSTEPFMWQFPEVTIEPGQHLIVFASGKDRTDPAGEYLHTNFRIGRTGDDLVFCQPDGSILDEIIFEEKIPSNISYGRTAPDKDNWAYFLDPTPGAPNVTTPYEEVLDRPELEEDFPVYINEYITSNLTGIVDEDGDLHDWIELYNSGDNPVNLKNYWLSDKKNNPYKWRFPEVVIEPDQYLVVFASRKNRRDPGGKYLHTTYALNDVDDELVFKTPEGKIIEKFPIRNMYDNVSYGRDPEDISTWLYYPKPTPGEPNYTQGFEALPDGTPKAKGYLHVNEVMAENLKTLPDEDGDYPDWIELYNSADFSINLEGYGLSDKEDNPFRWILPDVTIEPGQYLVVFASRKDRRDPEAGHLHTNYQIQATGETVVLTHPLGITMDTLHTGKLAPDMSVGRYPDGNYDSRYFFREASPGSPNSSERYKAYTPAPSVSHQGGFYDQPIKVTLEASCPDTEIRYTLDGKQPEGRFSRYENPIQLTATTDLRPQAYEEGQLYTGEPIEITGNTVLRVMAYQEGKLPSTTVNRSYFIGENHTLPVVSVMVDPDEMFNPVYGIYEKGIHSTEPFPYKDANFWKGIELPIHLEFYEPNGKLGLGLDMGLRLAGQYGRAMDQKSFNLFARNIYGYNEFKYPFFPDFYPEKPLANKAITLRTSGQDADFSKIRDIMMTSLLKETGLDYQAHRQSVLYINGEYWGIYNVRERINEHFVAYNHNLDSDRIDLLQANGRVRAGSNDHYFDMLNFARRNDLSDPDHYQYMQTQMDVINYIDYWVAQIYFAQTDSVNIRFWREQSPEGKWRWITFDLDWAFWSNNYHHNTIRYVTNPAGTGVGRRLNTDLMQNLLDNPDFNKNFIERLAHYFNHAFATENVINCIDKLAANIEDEVERDFNRWGRNIDTWHSQINILRNFARNRQEHLLPHIQNYFNLSDEEMEIFNEWPQ